MDYRQLIEKFYLGCTSLEEEQELRRYLMGDDLPPEVAAEKELLLAMLQPAVYDCSEEMEDVSAMIDALAKEDKVAVKERFPLRNVLLRYITPATAAAAVLLLMLKLTPSNGNGVVDDAPLLTGIVDGTGSVVMSEPDIQIDSRAVALDGGEDTFAAPEEVAKHMDALLSMFSAAAADGLNEQKELFRHFALLNEPFK